MKKYYKDFLNFLKKYLVDSFFFLFFKLEKNIN
jgi:hypothetical protein